MTMLMKGLAICLVIVAGVSLNHPELHTQHMMLSKLSVKKLVAQFMSRDWKRMKPYQIMVFVNHIVNQQVSVLGNIQVL